MEFKDNNLNPHPGRKSKDALCQVWLKLAQWFWRRRFFNFVNVFFSSGELKTVKALKYMFNFLTFQRNYIVMIPINIL